jgi:hypothetical protein
MLVQRHLDGGVGGWLVHAGGSVVVLRVFQASSSGDKEE